MKDPSLTLARQVIAITMLLAPRPAKLLPVISKKPAGSPPVHVTGTPLARTTELMLSWFVQTKAGGTVRATLKLPTDEPPGPVTVYVPGSK